MDLMNKTAPALCRLIHNFMEDAGGIINRSANTMEQGKNNILIG